MRIKRHITNHSSRPLKAAAELKRYGSKMKKHTLIMLFALTSQSFAQDIEIASAQIACLGYTNNIYTYGIELVIKNNSEKNISLISKTNFASFAHQNQGEPTEITMSYAGVASVNDVPIIPPREKLGIIELFPGEGAIIEDQVHNKILIEHAFIVFNGPDVYERRFHNWVGTVKSNKLKVHGIDSCKP